LKTQTYPDLPRPIAFYGHTETPLLLVCFAIAVHHHGQTRNYRSSRQVLYRSKLGCCIQVRVGHRVFVQVTCKCCDAPPFLALTSTRKVAHICGIPSQGIAPCSHSLIKLTTEEVGVVACTTKSGREWLERGAGGPSPNIPVRTSNPAGAILRLLVR